jgi:hypothetical protein
MAQHFRHSLFKPTHTLMRVHRTLAAGLYQVTSQGGGIKPGTLICFAIRAASANALLVDRRYLINPPERGPLPQV